MIDHRNALQPLPPGMLYGDRYRIVGALGSGGMGQVYLTEDTRLAGKRRALKLVPAAPDERESFIREARILSELQHPNLPDITDYYPPDRQGVAGIVMEYIAGEPLSVLFERSGSHLPFARVYRYLVQLSEVLCYLHSRQPAVVFRDLKPANVLIDAQDHAVLIDFGIARSFRAGALSDTQMLGTPAFAAPEQLRGEQTDARTDLHGWGSLAFFLLSGGQFAIRRSGSVRHALQPDVPPGFGELLEHVLAEHPDDRPRDAAQLRGMLDRWAPVFAEPDAQEPQTPPARFRSPASDGILVAAVLSAYPGAGATFASLGLSRALSLAGTAHALVECPGLEPELYALLDGSRRMPKHAAFADPRGHADPVPAWQDGRAAYYPLDPGGVRADRPDGAFASWIRRLGVPVVILDVSSRWESPGLTEWLAANVNEMWWVADSLPAKWSVRRQEAAAGLQSAAARNGISSGWIANRDMRFASRGQWLSCFPQVPLTVIPQFPADIVVEALWRGAGFPSRTAAASAASRSFQKWAAKVIESLGSYHLFHERNKMLQ